jgi:PAS domain-containing protein
MDKNITYEQIFYATSNGVVITDASGNIVYINQRAEKFSTYALKSTPEFIFQSFCR